MNFDFLLCGQSLNLDLPLCAGGWLPTLLLPPSGTAIILSACCRSVERWQLELARLPLTVGE